ncbi:MAG: aminotransferase class I/II-fold pyridoxal phosphate-dependent enzyme [Pseudomonadota bacterium]
MKIEPFQSERLLSVWQNHVTFDFTETGVHPLFLNELVTREELDEIYETTQLRYIQTNGTPQLKDAICGMYDGVAPDNILVTNGSAEANFITLWRLLDKGDEIATMLPNYMQVPGYARSFGVKTNGFYLSAENGWRLDTESLDTAITDRTKLIYLCNPNNPTGAILTTEEMDAIVAAADRVGAWILSDEVYRGAELDGEMSPTFWGRYDKTIVVSGLSKAYTLPGLRIGWLIAPPEVATDSWGYHDYTTITTNALSERLARLAVRPETRARILERNRTISAKNLTALTDWIAKRPDLLTFTKPQIGGVAFVGYNLDINSTALVDRLLHEKSVLIVPGDAFGLDHHVRIGYGHPKLPDGLTHIDQVMSGLKDAAA